MPTTANIPESIKYGIRKNIQRNGKHSTGSVHANGTVTVDKSRSRALQFLSTTAGSELARVQIHVKRVTKSRGAESLRV